MAAARSYSSYSCLCQGLYGRSSSADAITPPNGVMQTDARSASLEAPWVRSSGAPERQVGHLRASHARSRSGTAVDKCLLDRLRCGDAPEEALEIIPHLALVHAVQFADGVNGGHHVGLVRAERFPGRH